ncbi:carbohydrate ABC transporter permease [Helicovermis profundi]|uniref:Sugar ABC transporter permease n=1 Tax=Helicovermis profundi TaxID=3065157 RepID=A0AAU9E802_9FIRM|nr:sugar ABC transporter permease [Clostridia bacterium S502]
MSTLIGKFKTKRKPSSQLINKSTPYLYMMPAMIIMLGMVLYPFMYGVWLSFTNMSLTKFFNPDFIGLRNYIRLFQDGVIFSTFNRTIIWTFVNVFFHVSIGLFLAILLNRKLPGKSILRVLLIIPWAVPQYISALTWKSMFNYSYGAINIALKTLGFTPINWLSDPTMTFVGAIITNIWLGVPFMMMIALGGLQSIDASLYEAAEIDGASNFQKFKNITLPLLKPVMTPAIILGTVWTFNQINVIILIAGGFGNEKTQILVTEVYRLAFNFYRYGYAAAYSVVIFLMLLVFSLFYVRKTGIMKEVD